MLPGERRVWLALLFLAWVAALLIILASMGPGDCGINTPC